MYGIYCAVVMIFTFRIGCSHIRIWMVRAMKLLCIVHVPYLESFKIGLKNLCKLTTIMPGNTIKFEFPAGSKIWANPKI